MRRFVLFIFLLSLCNCVFSQVKIQGRVVDANNMPLSFANVVLLSSVDSSFVKGTITSDDGSFMLETDKLSGFLEFSTIGFDKKMIVVGNANVGTVMMAESSTMLGDVVVKGHRPTHKLTSEGVLTNVEGTVLSRMGTTEDVLKNVPSLVKGKDNYEIFGKGHPVFYINSKKVQDISELDNIKSEDIKSVEVIKNPGAQYDASVKCVVKIKLVKAKGEGLGFDIRSSYGYNKYTQTKQQLNLNYYHNGFNVFGGYKFSDTKNFMESMYEKTTAVDTLWRQNDKEYSVNRGEIHHVNVGFTYDINDDQSIGASYDLFSQGYYKQKVRYQSDVIANEEFYDEISTQQQTCYKYDPIHQFNVYYNGKIGNTTLEFNTDFLFKKLRSYDSSDELSSQYDSRIINSRNDVENRLIALKLVGNTPVFGGNLSWGADLANTYRVNDYVVTGTDLLNNSDIKQNEFSVCPFLKYNYSSQIGNLSAGLRFEFVRFKYFDNGEHKPAQSKIFRNFFPSFSYDKQFGNLGIHFSYSAKTNRPTYSQLSNNVFYINRFSLRTGNPLLNNETDHVFEFMGSWKFLQLVVDYEIAKDAIVNWNEQLATNQAVALANYKNVDNIKTWNCYLNASPKIGCWSPQLSVGFMKQNFTMTTDVAHYSFKKPLFTATLSNVFDLPYGMTCSLDYYYQSTGNYQNSYITKERHVLGVMIRKNFMNDRLSLELQGADLLHKYWDGSMLYTTKMIDQQEARSSMRELTITLRYKYNSSKSRYKGTGAGQEQKNRL